MMGIDKENTSMLVIQEFPWILCHASGDGDAHSLGNWLLHSIIEHVECG